MFCLTASPAYGIYEIETLDPNIKTVPASVFLASLFTLQEGQEIQSIVSAAEKEEIEKEYTIERF